MHLQDVSRHCSRPRAAPGWARGSSRDDRDHTQGSVVGKRYTFVPDCEQGPYAYLPVCVGFIAYGPARTRMRQDVWPVVRCPGSRFFPAYLYSGEHSSKPEWLIARGRQRVRVTSRGEATRLLFSSLKGLQVKWGFRLEVKSRLALYPRRQHDHNVDATRRPAGQGSSGSTSRGCCSAQFRASRAA